MKIYIPLAIGQTIPDEALAAIAAQSLQCEVVRCQREGVVDSNHHHRPNKTLKLTGQTDSRNFALWLISRDDDEFVTIQDRDIVHLEYDNLERAVEELKADPKLGVVYLPWMPYLVKGHYKLQAAVYRKAALDGFLFRFDKRLHGCHCASEDMVAKGWDIKILGSDKPLIKELLC